MIIRRAWPVKWLFLQVRLGAAREVYRPVAARGSLMFFLIDSLPSLDRVYYFSMATFVAILQKGAR